MALPSTALSTLAPTGKTVTAIKPPTLPTTTPGQLAPVPVVQKQATAAPATMAAPAKAPDPTAAIKPLAAPAPAAPAAPKPPSPVMQAATQQALNQQPPATLQATIDKTKQFMSESGPDLEQQKARRLAAYDAQRARELEAIRQKTADVSNTGANLEDLTNIALEGLMNRQGLETELETSIADRRRQDALAQIAQGQATAKTEADIRTQGLNSLLNVQQAGEGEAGREFAAQQQASDQAFNAAMKGMDIEGQKALTTLKAQLDQGAQLTAQDFTASQNALDRELQKAMQAGDTARQKELQTLQQQFEAQMQEKQLSATMDIEKLRAAVSKDTLLTQQQFEAGQATLDREMEKALKSGDIAAQKELTLLQQQFDEKIKKMDIGAEMDITKLRAALDKDTLKTQQDFTAAQNALDREFDKAMQTGDVAAKKELMTIQAAIDAKAQERGIQAETELTKLQASLETGKMKTAQEFEAAQNTLDRELQKAMQTGDTVRQKELMVMQQAFDRQMKETDVQAQKDITSLKAALDKDQLLSQQDFQAGQSALDRELEKALFNGDTERQIELMQMKQEFDAKQTEKAQQYATAERVATQSYATNERMSTQDFDAAQAYLDREQQKALQNNDISAQKYLAEKANELQITRDTNAMGHDEKMAYLNAQIANAKAAGDFERQFQLLDYQTKADFDKLRTEQGFEAAQADLNRKYEQYAKEGDWKSAAMMQKASLAQATDEAAKDRAIEQLKLKMTQAQINTDKLQETFDRIAAAEEAGQVAPGAAAQYLNQFIVDNPELQIEAPDPKAVYKALDENRDQMLYQWNQTHPGTVEYKLTDQGKLMASKSGMTEADYAAKMAAQPNAALYVTSIIKPDSVDNFNKWFNQTVYGDTAGSTQGTTTTGTTPTNAQFKAGTQNMFEAMARALGGSGNINVNIPSLNLPFSK